MVITGRVKFQKVAVHGAESRCPGRVLPSISPRPRSGEDREARAITPETYSGVAVVAMEKVESDRSSREPSRIPASTPDQKRRSAPSDHDPEHQLAGQRRGGSR
jgi:hypothetical protein